MRKGFNFYASYDDVLMSLNDEQFVALTKAILNIQFFRVHIDDVVFDDALLIILWKSLKHSVESQIMGFCSKNKTDYLDILTMHSKGVGKGVGKGGLTPLPDKGKDKGKYKDNKATSENVAEDANVANLDDEYEYFKSLRQSHSDELKKYKTNTGASRRSSSTLDDNFKKYKKLRNVYSQTVLGIIIRADCTGSTPHDITGLLNTKFPTAMANLLKKQDNDLLDESLNMSDKEFITFMQHVGDM